MLLVDCLLGRLETLRVATERAPQVAKEGKVKELPVIKGRNGRALGHRVGLIIHCWGLGSLNGFLLSHWLCDLKVVLERAFR